MYTGTHYRRTILLYTNGCVCSIHHPLSCTHTAKNVATTVNQEPACQRIFNFLPPFPCSPPHPYSFASRSHCVPLPEPGPPRTKTTGGFAAAAAAASPPPSCPPPRSTGASGATAAEEAVIDGAVWVWVCVPLLLRQLPPQPPLNRAPCANELDDDESSNAVARIALVDRPGAAAAVAIGEGRATPTPTPNTLVVVAPAAAAAVRRPRTW